MKITDLFTEKEMDFAYDVLIVTVALMIVMGAIWKVMIAC